MGELVTGQTITDEQIRELRDLSVTGEEFHLLCNQALGIALTLGTLGINNAVGRKVARARCADAWNARQGAKS